VSEKWQRTAILTRCQNLAKDSSIAHVYFVKSKLTSRIWIKHVIILFKSALSFLKRGPCTSSPEPESTAESLRHALLREVFCTWCVAILVGLELLRFHIRVFPWFLRDLCWLSFLHAYSYLSYRFFLACAQRRNRYLVVGDLWLCGLPWRIIFTGEIPDDPGKCLAQNPVALQSGSAYPYDCPFYVA